MLQKNWFSIDALYMLGVYKYKPRIQNCKAKDSVYGARRQAHYHTENSSFKEGINMGYSETN